MRKTDAHTVVVGGKDPRQSDLTGCSIVLVGDGLNLIDSLEILWEVLRGETRKPSSNVILVEVVGGPESVVRY